MLLSTVAGEDGLIILISGAAIFVVGTITGFVVVAGLVLVGGRVAVTDLAVVTGLMVFTGLVVARDLVLSIGGAVLPGLVMESSLVVVTLVTGLVLLYIIGDFSTVGYLFLFELRDALPPIVHLNPRDV